MSIRWYYTTQHPVSGGSASGYNFYCTKNGEPVNALISVNIPYNNVIYGTENTPIYRVMFSDSILSTYWYYYINSNQAITDGDASGIAKNDRVAYARVVGVIDDDAVITQKNFINDENTVDVPIFGRWRAKNSWNANGLVGARYYLIPLLFTIEYSDNTFFTGDSIGNAAYANYSNIIVSTNNSKSYTVIGNSSGSNYTPTGKYKDMIIDFGQIHQHCPKFFLDRIKAFFDFIYPNTYTIKSTTGETVAQVTEQPPIKKTNLQWAGNAFQLSITGTNDVVQTLTWEDTVPQGYTFVGLSTSPNGALVIPLGESDISIESSTTFYPVFRPYKVPPTLFQIELYKNTAEANRVDKTDYLEYIRSIGGVMREASSVTDMTITLQLNEYPNFNYVKIPILKRYYFVNDITLINANLYELDLSVDPLMSYKTAILGLTAFVDRNELLSNPRIIDKKRVIEQGIDVEYLTVTNPNDDAFNYYEDLSEGVRYVLSGYKLSVTYQEE